MSGSTTTLKTRKVLVVDDDMNLRKIVGFFLQKAGFQTLEARHGREAIMLARTGRPDVIIMDVMMPVMDGFTACRAIRDDPVTQKIPIIMCTSKNRKEDLVASIQAGAEDFIVKPFQKDLILQKIEKVLSPAESKPSTRTPTSERRIARRRKTRWTISWESGTEGGVLPPLYKAKVLDISDTGLAFEFNRCDVCTGYEPGTTHPLCLFARHARRFKESEDLDIILNVDEDAVFELQAKIAHIFQWSDNPKTEKVGIAFTHVPDEAARVIKNFVEEGTPS